MTLRRRTLDEQAHVVAFGFCTGHEGHVLPGEFALATIDRPVLQDAARRLRARLAFVEAEITRRP